MWDAGITGVGFTCHATVLAPEPRLYYVASGDFCIQTTSANPRACSCRVSRFPPKAVLWGRTVFPTKTRLVTSPKVWKSNPENRSYNCKTYRKTWEVFRAYSWASVDPRRNTQGGAVFLKMCTQRAVIWRSAARSVLGGTPTPGWPPPKLTGWDLYTPLVLRLLRGK